ncbi:MAG: hypothetical protein KA436_10565 [Oligoflexales bacterium]|nr:hypothetical protein [Oligoflexales bacterium]
MSLKIGDPIFTADAAPAVLAKSKGGGETFNGKIQAEAEPTAVKQHFRHGYLKGLNPDERTEFNSVMDKVKGIDNPEDRVHSLQEKIQNMESAPSSPQDMKMISYLKAELFHLMRTTGVKPKFLEIPEYKIGS